MYRSVPHPACYSFLEAREDANVGSRLLPRPVERLDVPWVGVATLHLRYHVDELPLANGYAPPAVDPAVARSPPCRPREKLPQHSNRNGSRLASVFASFTVFGIRTNSISSQMLSKCPRRPTPHPCRLVQRALWRLGRALAALPRPSRLPPPPQLDSSRGQGRRARWSCLRSRVPDAASGCCACSSPRRSVVHVVETDTELLSKLAPQGGPSSTRDRAGRCKPNDPPVVPCLQMTPDIPA